jgi:hypothetical protein
MSLPDNSYEDAERAMRMLCSAGYGGDVIPVIPYGAPVDPDSHIDLKSRGKAPGELLANGNWRGLSHWQAIEVTEDALRGWAKWHPSWGLRTRTIRTIDIDEDDPTIANALRQITEKKLGTAPFRGRPGTPRGMLFYRAPNGSGRKITIAYLHPDGSAAKVEILGAGNQARVWGQTETGWPWWEHGSVFTTPWKELPPADEGDIASLVPALTAQLQRLGCTVTTRQASTEDGRFPLGHPAMIAADKNELAEALRAIPNTRTLADGRPNRTTDTYERVLTIIAAAMGGCGGDPGWILRNLVPWLRQWPNEDDWIEAKIRSFDAGTSVGADTLYSFARGCGWQQILPDIVVPEQIKNTSRPVDAEVRTNSVAEAFPAAGLLDAAQTDMTLAERMANEIGPELALNPHNQWAVWDGATRFVIGIPAALHRIRRVVRLLSRRLEGTQAQIANMARWLEDEKRARAVLAVMEGAYIRQPFDTDPLALNTPGGLVNLRTGRMRAAIPHDRVSMITPVAPDMGSEPSLFLQTVLEIVSKDLGKLSLLLDWMALQLQGERAVEKALVLQGFGANGKSLLCDIIVAVLGHTAEGGYAYSTIRPNLFTKGRDTESRRTMADLQGARAVLCTEVPDNWKPDEPLLKGAISGEMAEARRMYGNPEMLAWKATITFACNGRIAFEDAEFNLRRRLVFLQLREQFDSNPEFRARVLAEAPKILAFLIKRLAELADGRPSFWRPHTWNRADHLERATWQAVEDETVFRMHKTDPNSKCPVACQMGKILGVPLRAAESALSTSLALTTLRDVAEAIH